MTDEELINEIIRLLGILLTSYKEKENLIKELLKEVMIDDTN